YDTADLGGGMAQLVNVANGNAVLRWTPFSAPGRGLATTLSLTYNSLEKHSRSPVGDNWSLGLGSLTRFGRPLEVHPHHADTLAGHEERWVRFTDADGSTYRFDGAVAGDGTVYWQEP